MQYTSGEHDNPDGRIAEDIRIATESAIGLAHSLLYSILILGSFIDILHSVSGSLNIPGTSIVVPGYLVILAFLYAGAGTVFGLLLGRPLTRATTGCRRSKPTCVSAWRGPGRNPKRLP